MESRKIILAAEADRDEILALYKAQIGREYCPWTDDYPGSDTIDFDLSRDSLFVMKENGRIIAAVSVDEDEEVERLACWSGEMAPGGELSRFAVLPELQNQGIARQMLQYGMDALRERGFRSVHLLVNRHNKKAIASYAAFAFRTVGECHMYEQDFLCYEKAL